MSEQWLSGERYARSQIGRNVRLRCHDTMSATYLYPDSIGTPSQTQLQTTPTP